MCAFAAHVYGVNALANKQPKKTLLCALALKTYACSTGGSKAGVAVRGYGG